MVFRRRALGRGGFNALAAALVGFIAFSACHGFPPAVALSIDEYSRECLAIDVDRSIDADGVVRCLERLAAQRGAPAYVRFDHGPEFIAHAVADWCRFNSTDTVFIDPGSPWQNSWIESSNGRLRDEFLNGQLFDTLLEARILLENWRIDYNINRPHSAHGGLSPIEFVQAWLNHQQPQHA
jgi:putative transposase